MPGIHKELLLQLPGFYCILPLNQRRNRLRCCASNCCIMKLFTVITVCMNTEDVIRRTIQSVLEQDCTNFEYLIKDGGSRDRTLEIAESYRVEFEKRGIPYRIVSRPDAGVYDAMNQAVEESRGQWLIFMNAADCFAGSTVLTQVENSGLLEQSDIVYGDEIVSDLNLYRYKKARSLEEMRFQMIFRHQSVFTNRTLLEENPYSLNYRICSDYRFYLLMYVQGKRFSYFPIPICIFSTGGISSQRLALQTEQLRMYEEMPVRDEEAIFVQKKRLAWAVKQEAYWKNCLRKMVPMRFRQMRAARIKKKAGWKTAEEFFRHQEKDTL